MRLGDRATPYALDCRWPIVQFLFDCSEFKVRFALITEGRLSSRDRQEPLQQLPCFGFLAERRQRLRLSRVWHDRLAQIWIALANSHGLVEHRNRLLVSSKLYEALTDQCQVADLRAQIIQLLGLRQGAHNLERPGAVVAVKEADDPEFAICAIDPGGIA